ncbi:MAG TPA: nicotinamide riboside transporter PnuC [Candidatus Didemnitutus sp.]|nr:nicotinamide riboside transporter PnuC [Candidatus Didemnitutus sp.]
MTAAGPSGIFRQILDGALAASWPEQIATVLGILFVWLAMRESLWNFPVGIVQAAIFGWVCFEGRLFSETALQVIYLAAMIYGWWHWTRGGRAQDPLRVQRLSAAQSIGWIAGTLALWGVWGWGMARYTPAALPWWDGFVFASSVASQWLQSRKALENWIGWIVCNTVGVGVFWAKGYYWFAVLYGLFWFMAWAGLRAWWKSWKENPEA